MADTFITETHLKERVILQNYPYSISLLEKGYSRQKIRAPKSCQIQQSKNNRAKPTELRPSRDYRRQGNK